jgi:hypothetical protein
MAMATQPFRMQPGNAPSRHQIGLALPLVLLLVTLAACGSAAPTVTPPPTAPAATATATRAATPQPGAAGSPTPATPGAPAATRTASGTPGTPTATPGGAMYPEIVRRAIAHLAADLGVPEAEIEVVSVESTEWPDSSLGCPDPGHAYLTVITPGYLIFLKAGGRQYEYHTNEKNMVIRCPK